MKTVLLYSELRKLLAPVIPHACTDDMLPVLCQIAIATSGEYLVAQATDRFTAAFKRVKPQRKPPAAFAVRLQAADAKRMLNLLRPYRGTDPEITIEVKKTGEILVGSRSPGFALGFTGLDLEFLSGLRDHERFPNLAALLPSAEDLAAGEPAGMFSIPFMTRFRAALEGEYDTASEVRSGGVNVHLTKRHRPMMVTVGSDFVGLIMPKRPIDGSKAVAEVIESWRGTIPVDGVKSAQSKTAREAAGVEYVPETAGAPS